MPAIMPAIVNCNLDVALRTDNAAVYVCKGRVQCFNFTALKCSCSGNIIIKLLTDKDGAPVNELVATDFGTFTMNSSGICFRPADNLGNVKNEYTVYFTASNQIGDTVCDTTNFSVNFVYDRCSCSKCCKCK